MDVRRQTGQNTVQVVEGGDTIEVSEPIGDPARTSS